MGANHHHQQWHKTRPKSPDILETHANKPTFAREEQVGTGDGHLYVFEDGATVLTRSIKAHTGAVYTLNPVYPAAAATTAAPASGSLLSAEEAQSERDSSGRAGDVGSKGPLGFWSGGKDGLVKFFNAQVRDMTGHFSSRRWPRLGGASGLSMHLA